MSLRLRLAILCAVLTGMSTAAVATVAYVSTSSRMTAEVDRSAFAAADYLTGHREHYDPLSGEVIETFPGDPAGQLGPGGPGGLLDQVAVQLINARGVRSPIHTGPILPVTPIDRIIAAGGGGRAVATHTIGSVQFRIITVGLSGGGAVQVAQSLGQRDRVLESLRNEFALLALLVASLGALAGWFLAVRLTKPLVELTEATDEFSATGKLPGPLSTSRDDEVGRLAKSFAAMLHALEASMAQQHQLVRDAGHELRTPITSLRTNIELLERHDTSLSSEQRAELLGNLTSELSELTILVDEIVDVATAPVEEEPAEQLDLAELADRAIEQAQRRFGIELNLDSRPTMLIAQRRGVERAMSNLLENAVKFAGPNAAVTLHVHPGELSVEDNGPGVHEDDLRRIFDRFYRAEASKSITGSGLGLSIVAKVAASHGGTTFAENLEGGGFKIGIRWDSTDEKH